MRDIDGQRRGVGVGGGGGGGCWQHTVREVMMRITVSVSVQGHVCATSIEQCEQSVKTLSSSHLILTAPSPLSSGD